MQKNYKTKLVLFDLDGTLIDTAPDFVLSLNNVLKNNHKKPLDDSIIRNHVSDGSVKLTEIGFNLSKDDPLFNKYRQELLNEYHKNMTTSSLLFKGIDVVLEFLSINKILFGIVTNKPYKYAKPIIDNFIELNNSKILICPDNLKNIKPDPEGVLLACSKLNINPSETIYIGDHQKDLEAGLNAGCKVIGCRYGYSINENTNTYNADLINTPEEIISLIE